MRHGASARAGTVAFTSLVGAQLLHALTCRSSHYGLFSEERLGPNPLLVAALTGSAALQVGILAVPAIRRFMGLASLGMLDGVVSVAFAALPYVAKAGRRGSGNRPTGAAGPSDDCGHQRDGRTLKQPSNEDAGECIEKLASGAGAIRDLDPCDSRVIDDRHGSVHKPALGESLPQHRRGEAPSIVVDDQAAGERIGLRVQDTCDGDGGFACAFGNAPMDFQPRRLDSQAARHMVNAKSHFEHRTVNLAAI